MSKESHQDKYFVRTESETVHKSNDTDVQYQAHMNLLFNFIFKNENNTTNSKRK